MISHGSKPRVPRATHAAGQQSGRADPSFRSSFAISFPSREIWHTSCRPLWVDRVAHLRIIPYSSTSVCKTQLHHSASRILPLAPMDSHNTPAFSPPLPSPTPASPHLSHPPTPPTPTVSTGLRSPLRIAFSTSGGRRAALLRIRTGREGARMRVAWEFGQAGSVGSREGGRTGLRRGPLCRLFRNEARVE